MNLSFQLFVDKFIFKPLTTVFNVLTRFTGQIANINHDLDRPFRKIVVCKFKGMGSILQCTAMLTALRDRFPESEIWFVSTSGNLQMLSKFAELNRILVIRDESVFSLVKSLTSTWWKLVRFRSEVYIDLEMYSHFSSLFALFSLAKNRIGFYTRGDDAKLGIFTHMMFFNVNAPISRVYLQMAYLLGAQVKDYHLENFNTTLQETGNKKYIVINPNASDLRLERRWPMENFMYIIQNFTKYYPEYNICLIGSASEKEYVDQLLSGKTFSQVINLAGKTSFDQLLTLIKNAELVISNDTGPMHLAFALEKSVLALFGPCSPKQYSIFSTSVKVFYKSVYCSPCVHEFLVPPCKGNNICMQIISKEEVFMAVVEFMSKGKFEETLFNGEEIIYESSNQTIGLIKTQKR